MRAFLRANRGLLVTAAMVTVVGVAVGILFLGMPQVFAIPLAILVLLATAGVYWLLNRGKVTSSTRLSWGGVLAAFAIAVVVVGVVIQLVPYGRSHSNPPVTAEPAWDSPRTRELAVLACFDCHSNEAEYPWYSNVAPFSWAVQFHVDRGRDNVNYSEWDRPQGEAEESADTVRDGSMPPSYYLLTHSSARLTDAEKAELARGLDLTIGSD